MNTEKNTIRATPEKCPYCHGDMQGGHIRGDGRTSVRFEADDAEKGILASLDRLFGSGRINAAKYAYMNYDFSIRANYCPKCKKMIFDTEIEK